MSLIMKCDTCGIEKEVSITPSGAPVLPKGWGQGVAIVKNAASPRPAVHECGKPECRLVGHKPPDDPKGEGPWAMSGTR